MAETTTRPARARKTAPPAKKTAPAKAPVEPTAEATESATERYVIDCEWVRDTKTYAVFSPPKSSGCVGSFYTPLGTKAVKVAFVGPAAA